MNLKIASLDLNRVAQDISQKLLSVLLDAFDFLLMVQI